MRALRRNLDIVAVFMVALALVLVIRSEESRRADAAMREYDALAGIAAEQVDTWLDDHVSFQRSLAFLEPDAGELAAALEPGYVSFALFLDGDGKVLATHPERPDIGPGTDMSGRFSHIDAVLAGADQAFWASDAATTTSGSVAATAVAGPRTPPTVLTLAFDMSETTLPRLLGSLLGTLDGARWQITDIETGIALSGNRVGATNARSFAASGWQVDVSAPTSSIEGLVGGTTHWPSRLAGLALVAGLTVVCVARRRRAGALGSDGDLGMFDSASTPALLLDPTSSTVVRANAAMADLVGEQSARQLDGIPLSSVLVDDEAHDSDQLGVAGVLAGERVAGELRYWAQAEQRWGRVAAVRLERPDRAPLVMVEIHDLDDQRRRAAVLERQRTALEDMAGRVSHDLRTPITAMIGFAELLQRSPDAPATDRAEWVDRLAANARRLGEHVRDMADVAVDIAEQPLTDLRACASRAVKLHDTAIHAAGAEVTNRVPDGLSVAMPELLLRQVLANLVDNAVKYRDRSRPLVVEIDASSSAGGMVELQVADNGPGVAPERSERIFAMGVRGESVASPGSGLGLAVCRTLVEDFGGTLRFTDNDPVGARFTVVLPAQSAPWPTAGDPAPGVPDAPPRSEPVASMLDHVPIAVLVLGDDRELRDANPVALAQHGWDRDDLPAERWLDHLPDDSVRAVVLDALFTGRTESWQSTDGGQAGLVMTLDGDPGGRGALILSWSTAPVGGDDLLHDELTGLPDRAVIRARLVRALREAASSGRSTAVLSVDLDDFRSFNERRGLSAGDQVLQAVADRLRASAADEDSVARQGADEFVLVRPGLTGRDEALRVAERIRAHLAAPITLADGTVVTVPCSIGVAVAGGDHDPDLLLIAAAQALHEAQRAEKPTAVVEVS